MSSQQSLTGVSLIAGQPGSRDGETFRAYNPADGQLIDPVYYAAGEPELNAAVESAAAAAPFLAASSGADRAKLLRAMADAIDAAAGALIERAHLETALPEQRLKGEVARTSNQLRLFASVAEEGSWVMARIDTADPQRTPPKPDIRSMLRPLGPVAVFGASNFPLAFSVAGGDTASALAAGNPVIVKAHPAHPGTSELAGRALTSAVQQCGFPAGTFSLLFDAGTRIASALVRHPLIRAVGFTGSFKGGRALMDLAASREQPIPVYAEMGSANPVFILPRALRERGESIATGLHTSFTLGAGQFCTKPGLVFANHPEAPFLARLRQLTAAAPGFSLLSSGIAEAYATGLQQRSALPSTTGPRKTQASPHTPRCSKQTTHPSPPTPACTRSSSGHPLCSITGAGHEEMLAAARALTGHLTASIFGTEDDLARLRRAHLYPGDQSRPHCLQWLSHRRGSHARHGARRPVSGHLRRPLHLRRQPGHPALRAPRLLPGLPSDRATRGAQGHQPPQNPAFMERGLATESIAGRFSY